MREYRKAVSKRCDVTVWDDQVALFELAKSSFGDVDIVVRISTLPQRSAYRSLRCQIPNAGIGPRDLLTSQQVNGKLQPPKLEVIDVNLVGVLYSEYCVNSRIRSLTFFAPATSLALHYFGDGREGTSYERLKALVLISSLCENILGSSYTGTHSRLLHPY